MPNFLQRWLLGDRIERKDNPIGPLLVTFGAKQAVWPKRDMRALAEEGYIKNVIAYRCTRMICDGAASIPWGLYDGDTEITDHPLLALLKRPNPLQDGIDFMAAWYSWLDITGNAFTVAVAGVDGPQELWHLRPDRTKVVPNEKGMPCAYDYQVGASTTRFAVDFDRGLLPVLHLRSFHPTDDWYGLSNLDPAAFSVDTHTAAGAFNKSILENGAVPSGAVVVQPDQSGNASLTKEDRDRLKAELEARYQGTANAGRPMVLEGGLDWKPFAMNMKDLQFVDTKRDAAREIATAKGVPPMLLGIPGDNTFANYQEANKTLWRQTIIPLAQRGGRALTNWMGPKYGTKGKRLELRPNIDKLDALSDERVAEWERIEASTILTINEKRIALGYGKLGKEGDVILINSTQIPLDDAGVDQGGDNEDPNADPAGKGKQPPAKPPAKGK